MNVVKEVSEEKQIIEKHKKVKTEINQEIERISIICIQEKPNKTEKIANETKKVSDRYILYLVDIVYPNFSWSSHKKITKNAQLDSIHHSSYICAIIQSLSCVEDPKRIRWVHIA